MLWLLATMIFVILLGWTDHMLKNQPVLLVLALLGLGLACGLIQPINAKLAMDVTYPSDKTSVESVQQMEGIFFVFGGDGCRGRVGFESGL